MVGKVQDVAGRDPEWPELVQRIKEKAALQAPATVGLLTPRHLGRGGVKVHAANFGEVDQIVDRAPMSVKELSRALILAIPHRPGVQSGRTVVMRRSGQHEGMSLVVERASQLHLRGSPISQRHCKPRLVGECLIVYRDRFEDPAKPDHRIGEVREDLGTHQAGQLHEAGVSNCTAEIEDLELPVLRMPLPCALGLQIVECGVDVAPEVEALSGVGTGQGGEKARAPRLQSA